MKTKEELIALKEEVEALKKKLAELTEDELKLVAGGEDNGMIAGQCPFCAEYEDYKRIDYSYKIEHWHCGNCGDLTYFRLEYRWERGYI